MTSKPRAASRTGDDAGDTPEQGHQHHQRDGAAMVTRQPMHGALEQADPGGATETLRLDRAIPSGIFTSWSQFRGSGGACPRLRRPSPRPSPAASRQRTSSFRLAGGTDDPNVPLTQFAQGRARVGDHHVGHGFGSAAGVLMATPVSPTALLGAITA